MIDRKRERKKNYRSLKGRPYFFIKRHKSHLEESSNLATTMYLVEKFFDEEQVG